MEVGTVREEETVILEEVEAEDMEDLAETQMALMAAVEEAMGRTIMVAALADL